jgi:hypothetical protein
VAKWLCYESKMDDLLPSSRNLYGTTGWLRRAAHRVESHAGAVAVHAATNRLPDLWKSWLESAHGQNTCDAATSTIET